MKIVLLRDVASVGSAGEVKEVASGYARNYLMPRGLAVPATAANIALTESQRRALARHQARGHDLSAEAAARLEGMVVRLQARVGSGKRLYGSITAADIAEEVRRLTEIEVDKRKVALEEPIRHLGSYEVAIKLAKDVATKVKVVVEEAPAKP